MLLHIGKKVSIVKELLTNPEMSTFYPMCGELSQNTNRLIEPKCTQFQVYFRWPTTSGMRKIHIKQGDLDDARKITAV